MPDEPDTAPDVLKKLQDLRQGRLHLTSLTDEIDLDEENVIAEIEAMLSTALDTQAFSEELEERRILGLDYLGERIVGRIPTHMRNECLRIFEEHVARSVLASDADSRLKKSVLGDKVEIMEYIARFDEERAYEILARHRDENELSFLKAGISNGLWRLGVS